MADVGQAYGGASALLSAAALCGVVASLLFQRRQVRQELAEMDRQHHVDLIRLALDNPEFIEVIDARTAMNTTARQELFLNLMTMYWLAVWELGVVDDVELRAMAADMFCSETSRRWWSRVGAVWISTDGKPGRRQFVAIISAELVRAELKPALTSAKAAPPAVVDHHPKPSTARRRRDFAVLTLAAVAGGLFVAAAQSLRVGKK